MKKIKLFKIELTRIFGGWVETDDIIYGFYGIIPAWYSRQKWYFREWRVKVWENLKTAFWLKF